MMNETFAATEAMIMGGPEAGGPGGPPGGDGMMMMMRKKGSGPPFSSEEVTAIVWAARCSAMISFVVAIRVVWACYLKGRHHLTTMHRLFLGLAINNVNGTFWLMLGSLPVPVDGAPPFIEGARGNTMTCSAQAFFLHLGLAVPMYNAMVMVYYMLTIRYGCRESFLKKKVEPYMHLFAFLIPLTTAITGLSLKIFNPAPIGRCFTAVWPMGCNKRPNGVCERGTPLHYQVMSIFEASIFFTVLFVEVLCLLLIYFAALQRHRESMKSVKQRSTLSNGGLDSALVAAAAAARTSQNTSSCRSSVGTATTTTACVSPATARNLQMVTKRSIVYGIFFITTYIWIAALHAIRLRGRVPPFWLALVANFFFPLQGSMVGFYYLLAPPFDSFRRNFPGMPTYLIWWYVFKGTPPSSVSFSGSTTTTATASTRDGGSSLSFLPNLLFGKLRQRSSDTTNTKSTTSSAKTSSHLQQHRSTTNIDSSGYASQFDLPNDDNNNNNNDNDNDSTVVVEQENNDENTTTSRPPAQLEEEITG